MGVVPRGGWVRLIVAFVYVGAGLSVAAAHGRAWAIEAVRVHGEASSGRCTYCHDALGRETDCETCAHCETTMHSECRRELGRCATMGCASSVTRPGPARERGPIQLTRERVEAARPTPEGGWPDALAQEVRSADPERFADVVRPFFVDDRAPYQVIEVALGHVSRPRRLTAIRSLIAHPPTTEPITPHLMMALGSLYRGTITQDPATVLRAMAEQGPDGRTIAAEFSQMLPSIDARVQLLGACFQPGPDEAEASRASTEAILEMYRGGQSPTRALVAAGAWVLPLARSTDPRLPAEARDAFRNAMIHRSGDGPTWMSGRTELMAWVSELSVDEIARTPIDTWRHAIQHWITDPMLLMGNDLGREFLKAIVRVPSSALDPPPEGLTAVLSALLRDQHQRVDCKPAAIRALSRLPMEATDRARLWREALRIPRNDTALNEEVVAIHMKVSRSRPALAHELLVASLPRLDARTRGELVRAGLISPMEWVRALPAHSQPADFAPLPTERFRELVDSVVRGQATVRDKTPFSAELYECGGRMGPSEWALLLSIFAETDNESTRLVRGEVVRTLRQRFAISDQAVAWLEQALSGKVGLGDAPAMPFELREVALPVLLESSRESLREAGWKWALGTPSAELSTRVASAMVRSIARWRLPLLRGVRVLPEGWSDPLSELAEKRGPLFSAALKGVSQSDLEDFFIRLPTRNRANAPVIEVLNLSKSECWKLRLRALARSPLRVRRN